MQAMQQHEMEPILQFVRATVQSCAASARMMERAVPYPPEGSWFEIWVRKETLRVYRQDSHRLELALARSSASWEDVHA